MASLHRRELLQKSARKAHSKKIFTEGNEGNKAGNLLWRTLVTLRFLLLFSWSPPCRSAFSQTPHREKLTQKATKKAKTVFDLKRPSLPSFSSVEFLVPAQRLSVCAFAVKKLLRKKS
ncbi:MAG: hypothetical protein DMF28_09825 [Verrucomicrobia bacterium]|nr:MAG: hypothetical protein DMF28_09825 [Verrucomicrobiota bacterium]